MEHDFWHARWEDGRIGFHEPEGNALLQRHFPALGLGAGARVFVPLCGRTGDVGWLLAQGFRVAAAELSGIAIRDLFRDLGADPRIIGAGPLQRWCAPGLDVFVGDVFALSRDLLGRVDAVLDRAALVALPGGMRAAYAAHVAAIAGGAQGLVITFDYDQDAMAGPPFSVPPDEVAHLFAATHNAHLLDTRALHLKGAVPARESALHLLPV